MEWCDVIEFLESYCNWMCVLSIWPAPSLSYLILFITQFRPFLSITFFLLYPLLFCLPCYWIYSNHIYHPFFSFPILLFSLISPSFPPILLPLPPSPRFPLYFSLPLPLLIFPYTSPSPSLPSLAWSQSSIDEDASGSGIYSIRNGLHTPSTVPGSNLRCSIFTGPFKRPSLQSFIFSCCSFSAYECDVTWIHVRVLMYGKCDFRGRWQKRCVLVDMQISYSGRL